MAKRSVTVRIEESDVERLEALARKKRQATGDKVGISDVIRVAVAEYLKAKGEQDA
ncbi:ribbon-helix-helix protein, CopG family (plasmid) [Halomonas sediminis]